MLIGTDGIYSYTFEYEKRDDCPVCGGEALEMTINEGSTVEELIELLMEKQDMYVPFLHTYIISLLLPAVKSRNHHYRRQRSRFICKHHHNSKKPRVQTWQRKCQSWCHQEGRLPSQPAHCLSACLFAFLIQHD